MSDMNADKEKVVDAEEKAALEEKFRSAAVALAEADVLLLVTGAGWSADSGLPVYADIAQVPAYERRGLTYSDVARPHMIEKDPSLFYGFWGQALYDYRHTVPHPGFAIVEGWRRDKMQNEFASLLRERVKEKLKQRVEDPVNDSTFAFEETPYTTPFGDLPIGDMAGSFYCFTSNCDAHFYDFLPAVDIHDCHGNIELWQCSNRDCETGIWRAPKNWGIAVDSNTLEAPSTETNMRQCTMNKEDSGKFSSPRLGSSQGIGARNNLLQFMPPGINDISWNKSRSGEGEDQTPNWPKCDNCKNLARPAIFMFGDFGWKYDHAQDARWNAWRESVIDLCREAPKSLNVCIVEVGCGKNVATCRTVSESLLEELVQTGFGGDSCLVRINPDFPEVDDERLAGNVIAIPSKGLAALESIQVIYAKR